MSAKDIQICIGVDVDAVAGWLGSYGGQDSPNDIQRGMFAGEVGTPRLVTLFDRLQIPTTWFMPGANGSLLAQELPTGRDALGLVTRSAQQMDVAEANVVAYLRLLRQT